MSDYYKTDFPPDDIAKVRRQIMVKDWKRKHAELSAKYVESTNDMAKVWADYNMATNMNAVTRERLEAARDKAILPARKAVLQNLIDSFYPDGNADASSDEP